MMSFLNVFKKNIVTIATIIIPILVYLGVDLEILIKSVQEHTKTFIIIFAITLSILSFIIGIIIDDKKNKDLRIKQKTRKHPVLIFDDERSCLRDLGNKLDGSQFDTVRVRDVSDYRLAENFDIIIGDLMNVGPITSNNSTAVLNAIKERYPYKIVIAMSKVQPNKNELLVDDFISKENRDEFPKEVLKKIMEYSTKMDDIDNHWKATEAKLKDKGMRSEQINQFKSEYYKACNK